jgi:hypothetical protein
VHVGTSGPRIGSWCRRDGLPTQWTASTIIGLSNAPSPFIIRCIINNFCIMPQSTVDSIK